MKKRLCVVALMASLAMLVACENSAESDLLIGWGECDVTPSLDGPKKVPLIGQYYAREAKGIESRLMFSACAMRQGDEQVMMCCMDAVGVLESFVEMFRAKVHERLPEMREESLFINTTHSHATSFPIDDQFTPEDDRTKYITESEYLDMVLDDMIEACVTAWNTAKPGRLYRAFGNARLGHCRLALYKNGFCEMYGDCSKPDFIGLLEGEDNGVEMLFTADMKGRQTGVIVNTSCPAQVMELLDVISSDFAGAMREKLKACWGKSFHTIYHYGHGGDQSPRDLTRAGQLEDGFDGWHTDAVEALGERLATCVKDGWTRAVPCPALLRHRCITMELPIRRVTAEDVAKAKAENEVILAQYPGTSSWDDFLRDVAEHQKDESRLPYDTKLHPYSLKWVNNAIIERWNTQDITPMLTIESHIIRLGDVAFASNPFELYLRYGQIIKARSVAKQTFVISNCGAAGYLPTEESENVVGYSGGVNVGMIGHEGGYMFCDNEVAAINALWEE